MARSVNFIMGRNFGVTVNTDRGILYLYPYGRELEPQYIHMGDMLSSCYVFSAVKRQKKEG